MENGYGHGTQVFLIDDTSLVLKDEKKLMERAGNFAFYTQGREWNDKPIKIAVFSRETPLLRDEKYEYVGNKNQIPPDLKVEWKHRYIADYDCESDTITFFPADPVKEKKVFFHWKGTRYKGNRIVPGEHHPNDLFRFDTLR